ncbi:MAG: heavy-metal-associated domain-containing protein [Clostridiales bacterium]|nr:heavy-metal-associated domain-containing protein [Clostridiales bacterium]
MRKTYNMIDLDCANCAMRMEQNIAKLNGVRYVSVNFLTQKMIIDIDDGFNYNEVMKYVRKTVQIINSDCDIDM